MTPPCTLCEVVGHATNNCLELPHLKPLVHEMFLESSIPEVQVTLQGLAKKLKTLRMNHPCALCDHYGNYSHCFPHLEEFRDCLHALASTRPLIVDHLLLYAWIMVPLVHENRETLVPPS